MCGRFTLKADIETIAKVFHVKPSLAVSEITPRYNIAPTQEVISILSNGASHLEALRWGLIPSWAKDEAIGNKMINARAETLAENGFHGAARVKCDSRNGSDELNDLIPVMRRPRSRLVTRSMSQWVIHVGWARPRQLPVYPGERTFSG